MNSILVRSSLCIVAAVLLASCGGGGGGGGGGDAPPVNSAAQNVISTGNAKAVAADALDASFGSASVRTGTTLVLASAVSGDVTLECTPGNPAGGTLRVAGSIASPAGTLQPNDSVTLTASACQKQINNQLVTVNGSVTMKVVSGSFAPGQQPPFHIVMSMGFTNFSVSGGGVTETANGDLTMDLDVGATSEVLTVSGPALALVHSKSGATRSRTLRNYSFTIRDGTTTQNVSATVESVNSRIGAGTFTYQITAPTPIVISSAGAVTAGALKVTSGGVVLQVRVTSTDVFAIDLDLNGDGATDAALSANKAELESLL